jgi:hypothetical protein
MNEYYNNLAGAISNNDLGKANEVVMSQIGSIIANKREDFIDVLNNSGIEVSNNVEDIDLVDSFLDNIDSDDMLLNVSILVNHNNQVNNFDGEPELSDIGVKSTYKVLTTYFDGENNLYDKESSNFIGEKRSNGWGDFANTLAKTGTGIYQDIKNKKTGGQDALNKQKESRNQLVASIIAQKQAKIDAQAKIKADKEKTNRTIFIVAGLGIGLVLLGGIYLVINKK